MLWCDQLTAHIQGPQTVNDSKTPSGPVHVGSLRGVLIHDAVYRTLHDRGLPVRYIFGVDDYDPLDELPPNGADWLRPYLGMPLCNVPPPAGSPASDFAEHYIREFFEVFDELGVSAETYRMRDIYRSGKFDTEIDLILRNADKVRAIDRKVAGANRSDDWFPFQVICEGCGRIGTTSVTLYDGETVYYTCVPHLVKWATGCGNSGRVSPFGGNGKLSWKLEWVAKWNNFPVTIEGAGKDHNTKGGSREVAARCLKVIFGKEAPVNIPYEFFLVSGAKMSSSRGVGVSAREMANLLPPQLLRFLMIRALPKRPVDFSPVQEKIVRLYSDFDRLRLHATDPQNHPNEARLYSLCRIGIEDPPDYYAPPFDLVLSLVQMPHLVPVHEVEHLKGDKLTSLELQHLNQRVASARYWLERFAENDELFEIKKALPAGVASLRPAQLAFLHKLSRSLKGATTWEPANLQVCVFDTARLTPISQADAFRALYGVLLDRQSGPRAGNLLAFLDSTFVQNRLNEAPLPTILEFQRDTSISEQEFDVWLRQVGPEITSASADTFFSGEEISDEDQQASSIYVVDFIVTLKDGKTHVRRVTIGTFEGVSTTLDQEHFASRAAEYVSEVADRLALKIPLAVHGVDDGQWL